MPSEKRARQRANRDARVAQLQRRQQKKRTNRQLLIAGVVVVIFLGIAFVSTTILGGSSKKHKTVTATTPTTLVPTDVATSGPKPLAPAALQADLLPRTPPAISPGCNSPAGAASSAPTVPAKGNAVAIIPAPATVPFPKMDGSSAHYTKFSSAPPFCIDVTKTYTATMVTDVGTITLQLLAKDAPITVDNFVFLAGYHYFDGTVFHRVIPGFVDQGGDPTATGAGSPGYKFADELPPTKAAYDNGAFAMANSGPNTNGSQFFIVVDNGGQQLSAAYTAYGQVTNGLNVAEKINADGDSANGGTPPKVTHRILSVSITQS